MASNGQKLWIDEAHSLATELRELIITARDTAARSVNALQVAVNFEIGRRIVEREQKGAKRAEYGKALLKELSAELTAEFGRGFSRSNLEYMRRFSLAYQDRTPQISQTASGKFPTTLKSQTASGISPQKQESRTRSGIQESPFTLSWSQYVFLISIDDTDERRFYEIEATANDWTLPQYANIHAREYRLYLPDKNELRKKLMEWTAGQDEEA